MDDVKFYLNVVSIEFVGCVNNNTIEDLSVFNTPFEADVVNDEHWIKSALGGVKKQSSTSKFHN